MKEKEIELTQLKALLREKMHKQYGGVDKFLHSEDGQKFGGMKIKAYLYPAGATSFEPLKNLAAFFGIGELTKQTFVEKKTVYYLKKCQK